MKSGRKLDALIATKVLGERLINGWTTDSDGRACGPVAHYSTSISDAWEVAESIGNIELRSYRHESPPFYEVHLCDKKTGRWYKGNGNTAEHAICLAALATKGIKV